MEAVPLSSFILISFVRLIITVVLPVIALVSLPQYSVCTEVTVAVVDGRLLTGEVDSRTDDEALWLRRFESSIILTTAISWDDVVAAEVEQQTIEGAKIGPTLQAHATPEPRTFLTEYEMAAVSAPISRIRTGIEPRVASIAIDTGLVNLDRTVEPDGLLVVLSAIDHAGHSVPVRGGIAAKLIVERIDFHSGRVRFEEFQRWTSALVPADFVNGTAVIPLRFRRLSPEFDRELCTAALLNVRLSVHGEGNFEASVPVAIHEFNPIRDEYRNQHGARFFHNELTHSPRQEGPRNLLNGFSTPNFRGY